MLGQKVNQYGHMETLLCHLSYLLFVVLPLMLAYLIAVPRVILI